MTVLSPKELLTRWCQFMNSHEAEKLAELYHEDAISTQIAIGTPLRGRAAIRQNFQEFFQTIPDTFTKVENLLADGDWAVVEWSGGGTFKPTNKTFTLRGCGFFLIQEGKIKVQRGYWDKATWFGQIGLPIE